MPNFDSGSYFLTTLIPVSRVPVREDGVGAAPPSWTSPVHALRKDISRLPTAWQTPETTPPPEESDRVSPFAHNKRVHFARLVVIDDAMFVGRQTIDAVLGSIITIAVGLLPLSPAIKTKIGNFFDPIVPQPQDHFANPYLFFSADFDATDGSDEDRDSFLRSLWQNEASRTSLTRIFRHCHDFTRRVTDPVSFAKYIAECQVETTMPFHDYYLDNVPFGALPPPPVVPLVASFFVPFFFVLAALHWFLGGDFLGCFGLLLKLLAALAAGVFGLYKMFIYFGNKPLPPPTNATLPEVLKSLYVRRAFTQRVIKNQMLAVDPTRAQELYDDFANFIAAVKPADVDDASTTQPPGVIGL